jgi:glucosamine-6-phosphate deaminase
MKIHVFSTARGAATAAAAAVALHLRTNPAPVLGLPTGRTVVPIYDELVRLNAEGAADFARTRTFNLDEFVGLSEADCGSFRRFMEQRLFSRVNLPPGHVHFLDGRAKDLDVECLRFERAIVQAGGIDATLLGIGVNGHIGFNEPGRTLVARTHRARLQVGTRRANAGLFGGRTQAVPREALTMGMATILESRAIIVVATGGAKARAVASMAEGDVTTMWPASFLQLHRNVQVLLDEAAAGALRLAERTPD